MNPTEERGLAIWAPAIRFGAEGRPLRAEAGPRERSLARIVASLLTQAGRRATPVSPTAPGASGGKAWVVSGTDATLAQALALPEVQGAPLVAWGFADLGNRFSWHLHLADRASKRLLWEGTLERERDALGSLLAAAAASLDAALGAAPGGAVRDSTSPDGTRAPQTAEMWEGRLPTRHPEALLELLLAMDVRESVGFGIRIPNPNDTFGPFLRTLELDPACALAFSLLADTAYRWVSDAVGDAEIALAALRRARDLLPKLARAEAALAESELRAGRTDAALESAKRFRTKTHRFGADAAYAEELAGRIHDKRSEPTEAASAFRRAVRLDSRRVVSWQHLGHLAAQLGRWDEAEICYVQAAQLEPGRADFQEAIKRIRGEMMRIREQRGPLKAPDPKDPSP